MAKIVANNNDSSLQSILFENPQYYSLLNGYNETLKIHHDNEDASCH